MTYAVDGCSLAARSRGLCHAHYMRWWTYGDVRASTPLVHKCDACFANPWVHRAPPCPHGHGPRWVLLFFERDGVEHWVCIEPGCPGNGAAFVTEPQRQSVAS